mmetsp:Transcript_24260/g.38862  ORF Transcript_24260/g.38862 Transcript_24260/m.38862 type:complete len:191 (+) Transcript_24260:83-655(+)
MARKKIRVHRENHLKKIRDDEADQAKKLEERIQRRTENKREVKEDLLKKLAKVRGGPAAAQDEDAKSSQTSKAVEADVPEGSSSKKARVIRTISKLKKKAAEHRQSAKSAKADRGLLRAAKEQGLIHSVKYAKQILEGKKQKSAERPNGKERTRDKAVRVKREQRERRGLSKPMYPDDDQEEEEEEEDEE